MGKKLLLLMVAFVTSMVSTNAIAQCADKFEDIGQNCIKQGLASAGEVKFVISKDKLSKIKGNTYFFVSENGFPGKFIIRSAFMDGRECSISMDVVSYDTKAASSSSGYLSIKKQFNTWSSDKAGFDRTSTGDFELYSKKNLCVFKSAAAKAAFYKNIKPPELIKGRDTLAWAGNFLIFLAVFLIARAVFQDEDRFKAQSQLEEASKDEKNDAPNDIVLKYSRPFFKRYLTPVVEGMKNKKAIREKYKRKLASAGMTKVLTPEDLYAFKLFLIVGFPLVFLGLRGFLEESWPLSLVPLISILGYIYPDKIWLDGKIKKRKEELIENMPFVVDMLALSVEAGLDFMAAIQKVLDKAPPSAITDEFEIMIKETKVGASRAEGLRQLSWRADCLPISSFTATLIAADSVGASIGPILKTLAAELRQKRSADAEKKGATAATKILFPMMLLIMPATGIIIIAPIALQLMGGGN